MRLRPRDEREPRPPRTPRAGEPPAELLRLDVEDWVASDELPPARLSGHQMWRDWARAAARSRWAAARRQWLADNNVPPDRACEVIPYRMPRFRDDRLSA